MLLTLASLAIYPPMMASVAERAPAALRATAFGLFYLMAALVVVGANVLVSDAFETLSANGDTRALWGALAALAAVAAAAVLTGLVRSEWPHPCSGGAFLSAPHATPVFFPSIDKEFSCESCLRAELIATSPAT